MTHSDFSVGHEFISGGKRWRCTDVVKIYEDYFDESGAFRGRTAEPITPMGENAEELVGDLYYMLSDALIRPVKDLGREGES